MQLFLPDIAELLLQAIPVGKARTKAVINLLKSFFTVCSSMVRVGVNPVLKLVDYRYPWQCF
ncbi:hypothetical protein D3C85_1541410 [compost metagenome]